MAESRPQVFTSVEDCVEAILRRVGKRVVLAIPLGLGKPNHIVNEIYRRVADDRTLELQILTALTLERPTWNDELERRLVEPLANRIFDGWPDLEYATARRELRLPSNVEVIEFFFEPGSMLAYPSAQQSYDSANYTHAAQHAVDRGANVVGQLVAATDDRSRLSLSCNPDITLDLLPALRRRESTGRSLAVVGQTSSSLPYMYGDAEVAADTFDLLLDDPCYDFPLFGPPSPAVSLLDHTIGLNASALIRDGGTLQVGIGSIGDALIDALRLRHTHNDEYVSVLRSIGTVPQFEDLVSAWGGTGRFDRGLYASSEMLVAGFLALRRAGVLERRVYPHAIVQRLIDDGAITARVDRPLLERLVSEGVIGVRLSAVDVSLLVNLGVFRPEVRMDGVDLVLADGERITADLADPPSAARIADRCLGETIAGGWVAHGGFFLGPRSFYEELRTLDREERERIAMTRISFINSLLGDEEMKRAQRRSARFVNTTLMATLLGAATSDGLEDGRIVSGVGGQHDFVTMAHALDDGRSVLVLRSTRAHEGRLRSNVVWSYGHTTIPRHLRDIVVTEYGIADLRGKSDRDVITAMLAIADSRFQQELRTVAVRSGKLPKSYRIPDRFRANTPERIANALGPYRERGWFQRFPFGTDLTEVEIELVYALGWLRDVVAKRRLGASELARLPEAFRIPEQARPHLKRLGLDDPRGLRERVERRALIYALIATGAIGAGSDQG